MMNSSSFAMIGMYHSPCIPLIQSFGMPNNNNYNKWNGTLNVHGLNLMYIQHHFVISLSFVLYIIVIRFCVVSDRC